jgi:glyoxylase-like metal-dependent hydrolase (beta-lactamase superfamily II)
MTPRIFLSRTWHEWLPIISYVVVTPTEVVLIDTGAPTEINDPKFMACDSFSKYFYDKNLRFSAKPEDTIDRQMAELSIDPESVTKIVITHFHADHCGRIDRFPNAALITGRGNWPKHLGSVPCTLPPDLRPSFPRFADGAVAAFDTSERLTENGTVRVVPMYGHTNGHVGVVVVEDDRHWLMAGDATFSLAETEAVRIAGVSEDVDEARRTQRLILRQVQEYDTVLLPAHEIEVFDRLHGLGGTRIR